MQTWDGEREFPNTNWADLLRIQENDSDRTRLLNELAERYWSPVFRYVLTRYRIPIEDAKDRTQEFFTQLLSRGAIDAMAPDRGHFRGFLKRSLQNFMTSEYRKDRARQPRDGGQILSIDFESSRVGPIEPSAHDSPDAAFDTEWRQLLLGRAISLLEARLQAEGKPVYWRVFQECVLEPTREGAKSPSRKEVAERLGLKPHDVDNYLRYARRGAREILVGLVRDYLDSTEDVEREVAFLLGGE